MIMVTKKGLKKDPELGEKIDRAVFPGSQGGPHDHTTAAIAVALKQASAPSFKTYGKQIVKNAKALAKELLRQGFALVGNGTENHMVLMDLVPIFGPGGGYFMQYALDRTGITLNKNTIPNEPSSPYFPSGVRLGTPALTTRGMKEKEMKLIAMWIKNITEEIRTYRLPKDKEKRKAYLVNFRKEVDKNKKLDEIRPKIKKFASSYKIFAW